MLWKVFGSTLALCAFAVVCLAGLVQGHSFVSVVKQSLVALAAGGLAGMALAFVVRVVVTEDFRRKNPSPEAVKAAEQTATGSGRPAAGQAAGKRSVAEAVGNRSVAKGPGAAGSRN